MSRSENGGNIVARFTCLSAGWPTWNFPICGGGAIGVISDGTKILFRNKAVRWELLELPWKVRLPCIFCRSVFFVETKIKDFWKQTCSSHPYTVLPSTGTRLFRPPPAPPPRYNRVAQFETTASCIPNHVSDSADCERSPGCAGPAPPHPWHL